MPLLIVGEDELRARNELLEIRRSGRDAAVMLLLDDVRANLSRLAGADVLRQISTYDVQRPYMELIESGELDVGGRTLLERSVNDGTRLTYLRQLLNLAGTLVVRSFEELRRIRSYVGDVQCNVVFWAPERELPYGSASKSRTIVLWSPEESGDLASIGAFGLAQVHRKVTLVAQNPPTFSSSLQFVAADDPNIGGVIASAACVVDLSADDPSWAHAFARRGLPLVVASTSGALETIEGIDAYDPWSFRSIANGVARAVGRSLRPPMRAPVPAREITRSLEASRPTTPPAEPLVSIVMPTYNRRCLAEQAVGKLTGQLYRNIEIIVVNDGGEDVGHLATLDPRIRVITSPTNTGAAAAINSGLSEAKGKYVDWIADDDVLYPDHVLRLVAALEQTSAVVAHSNTLLCTLIKGADGVQSVFYDTDRFSMTVDLCETYAYHRVARFMVRRTEIMELGGLATDLFAQDLEILIRLAERFDFVHVPSITSESWLRTGEQQLSTRSDIDHATELEQMFERHPAPGRPYIAALRKKTLENLRARKAAK